ncbi:MAG: hypothetical protein JO146_06660 [Candidatus Eremiobacteraeota bacterium]|nr:hypothetical protein [Candidatus Eremiobacteraeota bacterium]
MKDRIDELLELIEAEPEHFQTAELLNARAVLDSLIGKTVSAAVVDDRRVAVTTSDGGRYYFYGFLGFEQPA